VAWAEINKVFEDQWKRTTQSGEENGSAIFYEAKTNKYHLTRLSEGRHVPFLAGTTAPAMPNAPKEMKQAMDGHKRNGREVFFMAFYHTHPGPTYEWAYRNPSSDDLTVQYASGSPLGIIRDEKGYFFFFGGNKFTPDDKRANECIWELRERYLKEGGLYDK
jgi:hypothetical protein